MNSLDLMLKRNKESATPVPSLPQSLQTLKAVIIGCADMRVDPAHVLGIKPGEAVVMRNIGGRVTPGLLEEFGLLGRIGEVAGTIPGGGGEFHLIVAEIAGNQILMDMLRDLISRSSLIIAVYQTPGTPCCPPDEHRELALALERREPRATGLMAQHLDQVLADLRLEEPVGKSVDLRSVFSNGRRAL